MGAIGVIRFPDGGAGIVRLAGRSASELNTLLPYIERVIDADTMGALLVAPEESDVRGLIGDLTDEASVLAEEQRERESRQWAAHRRDLEERGNKAQEAIDADDANAKRRAADAVKRMFSPKLISRRLAEGARGLSQRHQIEALQAECEPAARAAALAAAESVRTDYRNRIAEIARQNGER